MNPMLLERMLVLFLMIQFAERINQPQHRLGIDPVLSPALDGLVVQLPLYGHTVRVRYQVGRLGHGPLAAMLDGQPLVLEVGHNRYRRPGVWVDAEPLRQRLADGASELHITLG